MNYQPKHSAPKVRILERLGLTYLLELGGTFRGGDVQQLEPCPFCKGSGQRVVPPAPGKRGNQGRRGKGSRHGYESTYGYGCRCDLCRAAHREYGRQRNKERT